MVWMEKVKMLDNILRIWQSSVTHNVNTSGQNWTIVTHYLSPLVCWHILVFLGRGHRQISNSKENTTHRPTFMPSWLTTCAWTSCHFAQMESIWFPQLMTELPTAWTSRMGICNLPLNWRQMLQGPIWWLLKESTAMDRFFRWADKLPCSSNHQALHWSRQSKPEFLSLKHNKQMIRGGQMLGRYSAHVHREKIYSESSPYMC